MPLIHFRKKETYGDRLGEDKKKKVEAKLKELWNSEKGGFIVIGNLDTGQVTDSYSNVTKGDVVRVINHCISAAEQRGALARVR